MNIRNTAALTGFLAVTLPVWAVEPHLSPPKAGKVEIMHLSEVKPGMKGTAWTVFKAPSPKRFPSRSWAG